MNSEEKTQAIQHRVVDEYKIPTTMSTEEVEAYFKSKGYEDDVERDIDISFNGEFVTFSIERPMEN